MAIKARMVREFIALACVSCGSSSEDKRHDIYYSFDGGASCDDDSLACLCAMGHICDCCGQYLCSTESAIYSGEMKLEQDGADCRAIYEADCCADRRWENVCADSVMVLCSNGG